MVIQITTIQKNQLNCEHRKTTGSLRNKKITKNSFVCDHIKSNLNELIVGNENQFVEDHKQKMGAENSKRTTAQCRLDWREQYKK